MDGRGLTNSREGELSIFTPESRLDPELVFRQIDKSVAGPFPFFGTRGTSDAWSRPNASSFSTWINRSPPDDDTATLADNPGRLPLVLQCGFDTNGNAFPTVALKSIGPPPWTITTAQAAFSNRNQKCRAQPLFLYDGSTAEAVLWYNTGNSSFTEVVHWTNITPNGDATYDILTTEGLYGFSFQDYFEWFRVTNTGTDITYSISPDGLLWFQIFTEAASANLDTITHVGFGVERIAVTSQVSTDQVAEILWNWVES